MAAPAISIRNEINVLTSLASGNLSDGSAGILSLADAQSLLTSDDIIELRYSAATSDIDPQYIAADVSGLGIDASDRYVYMALTNVPYPGYDPLAIANAPDTPPVGWEQSDPGDPWLVRLADRAEAGKVFTGGTGLNICYGPVAQDESIRRQIDITGYENDNLLIEIKLNDAGGSDETLEPGDFFYVEYAFGASVPGSWTIAIEEEADVGPGGSYALVSVDSSPLTINGGGTTEMWLRIRQNVGNTEAFVCEDLRVSRISDDEEIFFESFEAGENSGTTSVEFRDSLGNFKRYTCQYGRGKEVYFIFDLTATPDAESGTLDLTDLDEIRFYLNKDYVNGGASTSFTDLRFLSGINVSEGEVANPVNTDVIFAFLDTNLPMPASTATADSEDNPQLKVINAFSSPHRFYFGNGGVFFFDDSNSGGQYFSVMGQGPTASGFDMGLGGASSEAATQSGSFITDPKYKTIIWNTTTVQTITGRQFNGYSIDNNSAAIQTFAGCSFAAGATAQMGNAIATGTSFIGFSDRVSEGSSYIGCQFIESTGIGLEFDGTQIITSSAFTGNAIGINLPDGITVINLDNNDFSLNTDDFQVENIGGNVDIAADLASSTDHPGGFQDPGYVSAKVNITAGATVNVTAPNPTVTFSNIPELGSTLVLYNPDTDPDTQNAILVSTLTSHQLQYTGGTANMRVQVISPPGTFQQINLTLPVADQTIDVGGIARPELNYSNPGLTP